MWRPTSWNLAVRLLCSWLHIQSRVWDLQRETVLGWDSSNHGWNSRRLCGPCYQWNSSDISCFYVFVFCFFNYVIVPTFTLKFPLLLCTHLGLCKKSFQEWCTESQGQQSSWLNLKTFEIISDNMFLSNSFQVKIFHPCAENGTAVGRGPFAPTWRDMRMALGAGKDGGDLFWGSRQETWWALGERVTKLQYIINYRSLLFVINNKLIKYILLFVE